jgi:arginyl-tRNA synthetase
MEKRGKEISRELVKKQIAEISEGATIINLEKYNLGVWVLLRKDGTVLYSAKDLALAEKKFNEQKIGKSIYVAGSEQKQHFYQLFKTLELMKFKQSEKCSYVPVSEVRFPWGKMSSRTGDNVLYSEFIKDMTDYAKEEIKKRHKLPEKEIAQRALAIAVSALKYSMLKQDTNKNIIFIKEESLSFEGNTGPYLLYTYARAKSILRKAKYKTKSGLKIKKLDDAEKNLIFNLSVFPDIVMKAYNGLSPNLIANYAYQISQSFNEFYHSSQVIGSENEGFRLALVDAFSQTLKNALDLLGISAIEKM